MLYRVAIGTGFRASDSRSLIPGSFDLEGNPPCVKVEAGYSKNRKEARQRIRPDLAEALRPWLAGKPSGHPASAVPEKTAKLLRHDLEAAGIAYRDKAGQVADFHAFRHTSISMLVQGGASVKVAQGPARHSTPTLTTGRHNHATMADRTAALAALPNVDARAPVPSLGSIIVSEVSSPRPVAHQMRTKYRLARDGLSRRPT